jgi:pimeloyl-ACP methyl ester carboxylesterase
MAPDGDPDHDLVEWTALVGRHVRSSMAPPAIDDAALTRLVEVRVDILCGEHDVVLPPEKLRRAAARRSSNASFAAVPGAGHLLPHEQPGPLLELVRPPSSTTLT